MSEHILVTGGAGYIGGAAVRLLLQRGYLVTVLDDLSRGRRDSVPSAARFVVGSIADAPLLDELFASSHFAAVMHFAASAEVGESMQDPALYFRNNTSATLTLLQACLRQRKAPASGANPAGPQVGEGIPRFVFSSSAAVFGQPEAVPIAESAPRNPVNPYGQSKLQSEIMLEWLGRSHGLRYAVLRYFNAAGAWDGHGERGEGSSRLIPNVLSAARGIGGPVRILGTDYATADGTCVRDFVHIYDLVDAHLLVLKALDNSGQRIYNLGNGQGFSIREVIAAARRVTGRDVPFVEAERRPGDPPALVASSEKIRQELGWSPRYSSLEDILASAWEWHSSQTE